MLNQFKQYVPGKICLECDVCCRFLDKESQWLPVFTSDEIEDLLNKKKVPPCSFTLQKKIRLIPYKQMHACNFFLSRDNKCVIYSMHPFDCRLYPFILTKQDDGVFLGADTKCPFLKDTIESEHFKNYADYLVNSLSSIDIVRFISNNPELVCDLKDDVVLVSKLAELSKEYAVKAPRV